MRTQTKISFCAPIRGVHNLFLSTVAVKIAITIYGGDFFKAALINLRVPIAAATDAGEIFINFPKIAGFSAFRLFRVRADKSAFNGAIFYVDFE